ncbi:hypothetical protein NQZ68_040569 [Dissostichus eleginoides]|nr:hypothetical protein NQZ68_040569 [Dissostichus eleginoides]
MEVFVVQVDVILQAGLQSAVCELHPGGGRAPDRKMRTYLESYLNLGFMEGTDKTRPECVICREKLANEHETLQNEETPTDHAPRNGRA